MSWSVYTCHDESTNFQTIIVERFVGTFETEKAAISYAQIVTRHCRIRENRDDVRLNPDGTRTAP